MRNKNILHKIYSRILCIDSVKIINQAIQHLFCNDYKKMIKIIQLCIRYVCYEERPEKIVDVPLPHCEISNKYAILMAWAASILKHRVKKFRLFLINNSWSKTWWYDLSNWVFTPIDHNNKTSSLRQAHWFESTW